MSADPQLRQRLDRLAQSAALTAGCASALVLIREGDEVVVRGAWGAPAGAWDTAGFERLSATLSAADQGVAIVDDLAEAGEGAPTPAAPRGGRAPRFLAVLGVDDGPEAVGGLLVLSDPRPRPGLSAAKTYVLRALAWQIGDSFALQRLRDSEAAGARGTERLRLLESVVVHAKDSILITEAEPIDLPGPRIVYCNAAFTETTGYTAQEVIGQTPRLLQGVGTDPRARARIRACLGQWKPIEIEMLNYKKDGEPFWVELSIVPVADETGWFTHWVSVQRDITERKAADEAQTRARMAEANNEALQALTNELTVALEAAEAANIAKSQFLANMSHEIRTPLNGVLGMTQALWAEDLTPRQRERLAIIRDSGQSLLAVLNDVLDLSKIEAGRMELERIPFDLETVARGACDAFTQQANRAGVSFGLTVAPAARGTWIGDSVRLRQILYNLVSNALKFTDGGEVKVGLDLGAAGELVLTVRDTGIGIAPDKVQALFSTFYQADSSVTRRFGGTGLGLSICRQLCELMGGAIGVESELGRGSTFTARLPLDRASDQDVSSYSAPDPAQDLARALVAVAGLKVLAAEDNRANQLVLRALLQAFDITPVIVEHGGQAVEAWRAAPFDVILMDVQMPEVDGVTATRLIRAEEAARGLAPIPIIAVSANAMTHQIADYLSAGMTGHLAKPLDITLLAETLAGLPRKGAPAPARESVDAL